MAGILVGAGALALACIGEEDRSAEPEYGWLYGKWEWVKAAAPVGWEMTPSSEGFTLTYDFGPDGGFEVYRNGRLVKRTTYSVTRDRPSDFGDTVTLVEFADPTRFTGPRQIAVRPNPDTLILRSPYSDAPLVYFVRPRRAP